MKHNFPTLLRGLHLPICLFLDFRSNHIQRHTLNNIVFNQETIPVFFDGFYLMLFYSYYKFT
jgi:hypothetical protein